MEKRHVLTRQKSLDFAQNRSAMKVLEKYCRKKYRNSAFILGGSLPPDLDSALTPEPLSPTVPQVMTPQFSLPNRYSNVQSPGAFGGAERPQSLFFGNQEASSSKTGLTSRAMSELFEPPIKEEIKQRPKETRPSHLWRVIKFLYKRFGLQHVAVVLIVVLYSLFGGALFFYFEAPEEARIHDLHVATSLRRHRAFAECYCLNKCDGWLQNYKSFSNSTVAHRVYKRSEENCFQVMQSMLKAYDIAAGYEPIGKRIWAWNDYWNAVFYAWSLLTTIGYGNLNCRTISGRVTTILYASIGIPLMLVALNSLGKVCFRSVQHVWEKIRLKLKRKTKHLQKKIFLQKVQSMDFTHSSEDMIQKTKQELEEIEKAEKEESTEVDFLETFPMHLALVIVVMYISMCSMIFSFWEEWDYFTAFYFFFISLSTIGLGDEIPQNPHYACLFFIFFVIGLALVSMCVSIIQVRVENQYMAALMLIDEEHRTGLIDVGDPETSSTQLPGTDPTPSPNQRYSTPRPVSVLGNNNFNTVRWRRPMMLFQLHATTEEPENNEEDQELMSRQYTPKSVDSDSAPRSPFYRMPSSSTLSTRSSNIIAAPPVLSALLSRKTSTRRMKEQLLLRSESNVSHSEKFEKPESSPSLIRNNWNSADTPSSPSPQTSCNPLSRSSVFNAPLSVITEASDEEIREQLQKKRNSKSLHVQTTEILNRQESGDENGKNVISDS